MKPKCVFMVRRTYTQIHTQWQVCAPVRIGRGEEVHASENQYLCILHCKVRTCASAIHSNED